MSASTGLEGIWENIPTAFPSSVLKWFEVWIFLLALLGRGWLHTKTLGYSQCCWGRLTLSINFIPTPNIFLLLSVKKATSSHTGQGSCNYIPYLKQLFSWKEVSEVKRLWTPNSSSSSRNRAGSCHNHGAGRAHDPDSALQNLQCLPWPRRSIAILHQPVKLKSHSICCMIVEHLQSDAAIINQHLPSVLG